MMNTTPKEKIIQKIIILQLDAFLAFGKVSKYRRNTLEAMDIKELKDILNSLEQ